MPDATLNFDAPHSIRHRLTDIAVGSKNVALGAYWKIDIAV